jgi:hypothetical protein
VRATISNKTKYATSITTNNNKYKNKKQQQREQTKTIITITTALAIAKETETTQPPQLPPMTMKKKKKNISKKKSSSTNAEPIKETVLLVCVSSIQLQQLVQAALVLRMPFPPSTCATLGNRHHRSYD